LPAFARAASPALDPIFAGGSSVSRSAPKPRRSSLLPFYVVLGVVAVAGSVLLYRQVAGAGGTAATTLSPVVMTPEQLNRVPGIPQGSPDAPVVIMEFADFQCPACADFARFYKPLVADHIQNGNVRFVWYDWPIVQIHPNAFLASRAGRCANEQDRFWAYHDVLFGRQAEWSGSQRAADLFIGYAAQAGVDRDAFAQCLRSDRFRDEVSQSHELGNVMGVSGTPTLFVNGKRLQQIPTRRADWDALVQREMGTAAPAPEADVPEDAGA
jgi:protein-disulfide isomerase